MLNQIRSDFFCNVISVWTVLSETHATFTSPTRLSWATVLCWNYGWIIRNVSLFLLVLVLVIFERNLLPPTAQQLINGNINPDFCWFHVCFMTRKCFFHAWGSVHTGIWHQSHLKTGSHQLWQTTTRRRTNSWVHSRLGSKHSHLQTLLFVSNTHLWSVHRRMHKHLTVL